MATLRTQKEPAKMNPNLNLESAKTGEQQGVSKELTTEHCPWHHIVLDKKGQIPIRIWIKAGRHYNTQEQTGLNNKNKGHNRCHSG